MFINSWLNLAGYDLPMEEVRKFRQHHSMTPGHPEFPNSEHNTPGIHNRVNDDKTNARGHEMMREEHNTTRNRRG